ncbi:SH3 domain-containing protein [bacterium]|nr:SH3 domain-containing protein [bacterium]
MGYMHFIIKKIGSIACLLLPLLFVGCEIPTTPNGQQQLPQVKPGLVQDVIGALEETALEFQEMAKPGKVRAWVDNLKVKAQPGKEMRTVARLKEGEVATYLYQRTVRKEKYTLRSQPYNESWYLIKTKKDTIGWVHGGGIVFVQPDYTQLFTQNNDAPSGGTPGANQRVRSINNIPKPTAEEILAREKADFLVDPGKRVGPVHLNTSEDQLIRLYGPGITRGKVTISDKKSEASTIVMEGTFDEIHITWKDESRTKVKAVYIYHPNGKWHTKEGLKAGISMLDLTKVNKAPVSFYGFNWEYGGTVESYRKGLLAPFKDKFYVVLGPSNPPATRTLIKKYQGNKIFTSTTDGVENLNLKVEKVVVYLD